MKEINLKQLRIITVTAVLSFLVLAGFSIYSKVRRDIASDWIAWGGAPELKYNYADIALLSALRGSFIKLHIASPTDYISHQIEEKQLRSYKEIDFKSGLDKVHILTEIQAPYGQYALYGSKAHKEIHKGILQEALRRASANIRSLKALGKAEEKDMDVLRFHYLALANDLLLRAGYFALFLTLSQADQTVSGDFSKALFTKITENDDLITFSMSRVFPLTAERMAELSNIDGGRDHYLIHFLEMVGPFPRQTYAFYEYLTRKKRPNIHGIFCTEKNLSTLSFYKQILSEVNNLKVNFKRETSQENFSKIKARNNKHIEEIDLISHFCKS